MANPAYPRWRDWRKCVGENGEKYIDTNNKQFKIAAARVVLGGEMRAVDLARELGIKDSTLRRCAQEYEEIDRKSVV